MRFERDAVPPSHAYSLLARMLNTPIRFWAGAYVADSRPDSTEPPVGGTYVYWDHKRCTLDMANGTCY